MILFGVGGGGGCISLDFSRHIRTYDTAEMIFHMKAD